MSVHAADDFSRERPAGGDGADAEKFVARPRTDPGICDGPGAGGSIGRHSEGRVRVSGPPSGARPPPRRVGYVGAGRYRRARQPGAITQPTGESAFRVVCFRGDRA